MTTRWQGEGDRVREQRLVLGAHASRGSSPGSGTYNPTGSSGLRRRARSVLSDTRATIVVSPAHLLRGGLVPARDAPTPFDADPMTPEQFAHALASRRPGGT